MLLFLCNSGRQTIDHVNKVFLTFGFVRFCNPLTIHIGDMYFSYQMKILDLKRNEEKMFVLVQFKINMISNYNLSGVRVTQSVVFVWCFVDSYLSFCLFFLGSLYCLTLFDLRFLVTPLISTSCSYVDLANNISLDKNVDIYFNAHHTK